jgi:hypothetical protein
MCSRGKGIIAGYAADRKAAKRARCKSWDCPHCAANRAKQLRARMFRARVNRGFDLTIRHIASRTLEEETRLLKQCWRDFRLWWNRTNPDEKIECLGVWELKGPRHVHMHVVARCPRVDWKVLQKFFWNRIRSHKQWVKDLTDKKRRVAYITKYVTKQLVKLAHTHRYSATHGFDEPSEDVKGDPFFAGLAVRWENRPLHAFARYWADEGHNVDYNHDAGTCVVHPP